MAIVDYVHSPEVHEGFVLASFCLQTSEPDSIFRDLLTQGMVVKVDQMSSRRADGLPICSGWAGRMPDGPLVYCYVKHDLREFPIIPKLLHALELDGEVPVMFPSRQLNAIGRAWNINFYRWTSEAN